jgi:hypothetical protein
MGFNTTLGFPEYYDGTTWYQFNSAKTYTASYLIVAGGGASAREGGGGGGAGGVLTGNASLISGTVYTVTVGAGGTGGNTASPTSGSNSSFSPVVTAAV